jgi:Chaperone of endosialidase
MDSTNYIYLIGIIVLLFFLSYPNGGSSLFKPNRIAEDSKASTVDTVAKVEPKEVTLTNASSFQALVGSESLVIGNNNAIRLNVAKQAIDVNKTDIVFYSGTDSSTERLRVVGSNGFVGIGKTNPTSVLDVSGAISADDIVVRRGYSIMGNYGIGTTNPQVPLHVVGTTATTQLLASDKVGIGMTNPTYALQVAGTVQASAMSVGSTTAPQTSLDIYDSMHLVGKPFKVGGTQDTYYPVFVETGFSTYTSGKYIFGICRGNVHEDGEWTGAMNFYVEGKCYNCGNTGNYVKWRLTQGPQGRIQRFVAALYELGCGSDMVVWLRGGCTYFFTGQACKLFNGNSSGTNLTARDGGQYATRTTVEAQFDSNTCSGDTLTNTYTLGGRMGIGTSVPIYPFTLNTATSSYGMVHTDGTITVGSFVGGSAGGGWFGTKSNHNLNFFTNDNSAQVTLHTSGNVGIGTIAPNTNSKLDVWGTIYSRGAYQQYGAFMKSYVYPGVVGGAAFGMYNGTNELPSLYLTDSSYVGIGTYSPGARLTLTVPLSADVTPVLGSYTNSAFVINNSQPSTYGLNFVPSGSGAFHIQSQGFNNGNGNVYPITLNPMGGNVGIGVTNPLQGRLQVAGRSMFGYMPNYRSGILIDNEDAYGSFPTIQGVNSSLGTSPITINPAGGSVGIGTHYAYANWAGDVIPNSKLVLYGGTWGQLGGTARLSMGGDARHFSAIEGKHVGDGSTTLTFWTCQGTYNNNNPYQRMIINQYGQVGIGTGTPYYTLDVFGNARVTDTLLSNRYGTIDMRWEPNYFSPKAQNPGTVSFGFSGGSQVGWGDAIHFNSYYDSGGGNTNLILFDKATPGIRIWHGGFQSTAGYAVYRDAVMTDVNNPYNVSLNGSLAIGYGNGSFVPGCILADGNWGMLFRSRTNNPNAGDFGFHTYNGTERMRITNYGSVFYNGGIIIQKDVTAEWDYSLMIKFINSYPGYFDWAAGPFIKGGNGVFGIRGGNGNNDVNTLNNLVVVNASGYVAIGDILPSYPLHIANSGPHIYNTWFVQWANSPTPVDFTFYSLNMYLGKDVGNAYGVSIYSAGSIFTGMALYVSSDKRIKKDIAPLQYGLSAIRNLRPVSYKHIDVIEKGDHLQLGFIAQEVQTVIPELISITSDFVTDAYNMFTIVDRKQGQVTVSLQKSLDWVEGTTVKVIIKESDSNCKTITTAKVLYITSSMCTISLGEEFVPYGDTVFLYGKKVDDFHSVDYEKLTPVLTKAIQEVSDQVDTLRVETINLQAEVDHLRVETSQLRQENSYLINEVSTLKSSLSSLLQWARLNGFPA